jgi:multidrug efflux pump
MEKATAQVEAAVGDIPEREHVFIINGSASVHGFGGLLLKPGGSAITIRRRSWRHYSRSRQGAGAEILAFSRPSLPGSTGGPPCTRSDHRDYRQLEESWPGSTAARQRAISLRQQRSQIRYAANQSRSTRQGDRLGISMVYRLSLAIARRQLCQPFWPDGRSYEVIPQAPRIGSRRIG